MRLATRIIEWFSTPYSLYLILREPLISWKTKLKAGLILAIASFYILNPIDIIPDITPVIGWLDDLVIVPLFLAVAGKFVPEIGLAEIRQKARSRTKSIMFWALLAITMLILLGLSTPGC